MRGCNHWTLHHWDRGHKYGTVPASPGQLASMLYMNFDQNWLLPSHLCRLPIGHYMQRLVSLWSKLQHWSILNYVGARHMLLEEVKFNLKLQEPFKEQMFARQACRVSNQLALEGCGAASNRVNLWAKQLCLLPLVSPDRSVNKLFLHFISGHLILEYGHDCKINPVTSRKPSELPWHEELSAGRPQLQCWK